MAGTGLKGEYYDNSDFTNLKLTRTDATVNFDWGSGSPNPSIGADTFSVRWIGQVQPRYSETYTFYTVSDDAVRLWVNSQNIVDNWTDHGSTEDKGTISLTAGQMYNIKMEFRDNAVGAVAKLFWSSPKQTKEVVPQSQLYLPVAPPLGANFEEVTSYSITRPFVDVLKSARMWGTADDPPDQKAPVDADGWPTGDCGICVYESSSNIDGTYKLSFQGTATMGTSWSGCKVQNILHNATTNITTADVVVPTSSNFLVLSFKNTKGGIKNAKLIRAGYPANTTQTFTTEFLNHMKRFCVFRFMSWTLANENTTANWSDRPKVNGPQTARDKGVAWEYCIRLCNELNKDAWINVPHKATDDYVKQLATLLKNTLKSNLNIYVEYSNELWNSSFKQYHDNVTAAVAEVEAGMAKGTPSPLFYAGETAKRDNGTWENAHYWGMRRVAKRLKEISDIFKSVFGAAALNVRIRPVLAGQVADPEVSRLGLEFILKTYGPPNNYFYAIASAPYYGVWGHDSNPHLTKDQVIHAMSTSVDFWKTSHVLKKMQAFATYHRLRHIAYEGGPDTFGPNNIAAKKAASHDWRIKDMSVRYLNDWYSNGGSLFCWFMAGATDWDTQYGTWGLTDSMANQNAPKIQAVNAVLSSQRPPVTGGHRVPGQVDARNYVLPYEGSPNPYAHPYVRYVRTNWQGDYLLRADQTRNYNLKLNLASGTSNQLQILANGSAISTLNIPSTGGWDEFVDTSTVSVPLSAGLNVVRLKMIAGDANLQSLKFQ